LIDWLTRWNQEMVNDAVTGYRCCCVLCWRLCAWTSPSSHVGLSVTPSGHAVRTACCRTATHGPTCSDVTNTQTTPTSVSGLAHPPLPPVRASHLTHVDSRFRPRPRAQPSCVQPRSGALKMREWKMRYGQNCKGGKCRSGISRSR